MWKLQEVYAQNICAFRQLHYELQQGVTTLICGDNRDNESQGSNGSGKSALIESIAIGLTGSPLRKIKNEEIINDNSNESFIELTFYNTGSGEIFIVERKLFRKGSSVVICKIKREGSFVETDEAVQHSVDAYNQYILEKLGISKDELYNNFILSKHKYRDFLSCSDREKKEIINGFSNGVLVDEAIDRIMSDKAPLIEKLAGKDLELANIEGRISILNEQIKQEQENGLQRKQTKYEKINSIEKEIEEKEENISVLKSKLNKLSLDYELIKKTEKELLLAENSQFTLEDCLKEFPILLSQFACNKMSDWRNLIVKKQNAISEAEKELKEVELKCQESDKKLAHKKQELEEIMQEYEHLCQLSKTKDEAFSQELRGLVDKYNQLKSSVAELKEKRRKLSALIEELKNLLSGIIRCPVCGSEFLPSQKDFHVNVSRDELEEHEKEMKLMKASIICGENEMVDIENAQDEINENRRKLNLQKAVWDNKIHQRRTDLRTLEYENNIVKHSQSSIEKNILSIQQELEDVRRRVFDEVFEIVEDAYRVNERNSKSLQEEVKTNEGAIEALKETLKEVLSYSSDSIVERLNGSLKSYLVKQGEVQSAKVGVQGQLLVLEEQSKNFIQFKTYLANSKVEALAKITNEFLQNIGSDIRIKLSGYTFLKTGNVREKISVSLVRDGQDCGSFGKFSAGEAARVNLATILAMQKLINSNCEVDKGLDLLILDEILEAVDEDGLAATFEALNKLKITALIVSHGNIAESYPYKVKVIKENGESKIQA